MPYSGDAGPHERAAGRRVGQGAGRVGGVDGDAVERARAAGRRARRRSGRAGAAVYGSAGSSATARWVNTPASRRCGARSAMRCDERRDGGRGGADAVHPGVDLEVHVDRAVGRSGGEGVDARRRRHRRRQPVGDDRRRRARRGCSLSTRIGASIPAVAQGDALGGQGHAQPGAAGGQRRSRRRRRRRGRSRRP